MSKKPKIWFVIPTEKGWGVIKLQGKKLSKSFVGKKNKSKNQAIKFGIKIAEKNKGVLCVDDKHGTLKQTLYFSK